MPWSPGQHLVLLGLALMLALRLASGWAVVPAMFVLWVVLLLMAGLVDALFRRRIASPLAQAPVPAVTPAALPCLGTSPLRAGALPLPVQAGREWRRHVADLAPFDNERYPRAGICDTRRMFLREGDVVLLRFHPTGGQDGGAPMDWRCDLCGPDDDQQRWFDVHSRDDTRIQIERSGVYSLGIGQGAPGTSGGVGHISIWLKVPTSDALLLSLQPASGAACRYERDADGSVVARVEGEPNLRTRSWLPPHTTDAVPQGAALLFANATDAWDITCAADASSNWMARYRHLHRWYLQLSRGDVLVLEQAWQLQAFNQRLPRDDGAMGFTDGSLRLHGFVDGPDVYRGGVVDDQYALVCGADGFYCLELELHGPPEWRERPASGFIDLRLWGAFLQRPAALRDFDLREGWVESQYRILMPVPRDLA